MQNTFGQGAVYDNYRVARNKTHRFQTPVKAPQNSTKSKVYNELPGG